nr:hypothetical protein [Tanacetum cinerariifolium]
MAFVSSSNNNTSSTNETVNTAHGVSTAITQVNDIYSTNIDNLIDAVICSFFASKPNSLQLVHEDLEQIHLYDMEEMDLRWQMAMLTIRARSKPNSLQLVHEDLEQIHPYDMEEMDLRWQMAMLTIRARREVQLHAKVDGKEIVITESSIRRDLQLADEEDYEEIDEGFVAFGGNPKGGKITGK